MWFRKRKKSIDHISWASFHNLRVEVNDLSVEVMCLRKGLSEQREYNYLIKEGWTQDEYRYWSRRGSNIEGLYQVDAYKLAKQMKYKKYKRKTS